VNSSAVLNLLKQYRLVVAENAPTVCRCADGTLVCPPDVTLRELIYFAGVLRTIDNPPSNPRECRYD
jgi:hypothetical protein